MLTSSCWNSSSQEAPRGIFHCPVRLSSPCLQSEKRGKVGAAQKPSILEGCSRPTGIRGAGRGVGRTGTDRLAGLRSRFCLFSLCPSSTAQFPEPGMLGGVCGGAVGGTKASFGVGGERIGALPLRRLPAGSLPFSGGLSDPQRGCVLPPSFPPRLCSSPPRNHRPLSPEWLMPSGFCLHSRLRIRWWEAGRKP